MPGTVRIVTESGSTYVVGPGDGGGVRVARLSDHVVRGTVGPLTFAEDFARVGLVSNGRALVLECAAADGTAFRTSPIREVSSDVPAEAAAAPGRI